MVAPDPFVAPVILTFGITVHWYVVFKIFDVNCANIFDPLHIVSILGVTTSIGVG